MSLPGQLLGRYKPDAKASAAALQITPPFVYSETRGVSWSFLDLDNDSFGVSAVTESVRGDCLLSVTTGLSEPRLVTPPLGGVLGFETLRDLSPDLKLGSDLGDDPELTVRK